MGIIESLLDTDLYKYTMGQIALHKFPETWVKYKFKCRNTDVRFTEKMVHEINKEITEYCSLMHTEDELKWLKSFPFFKTDYIDFLRIYHPQRNHIEVNFNNGELGITVEGPWYLTIFFEVPILAIVNEVYFKNIIENPNYAEAERRLLNKLKIAHEAGFYFSEFGTRRRFSCEWQNTLLNIINIRKNSFHFSGTSNLFYAKKYGLSPIGTMAHELICVGQALHGVSIKNSQRYMLETWINEYPNLKIALSDTLGTKKFLIDFGYFLSYSYDGVRHDSGDPIIWGEKMIKHYELFGIEPSSKTFIFSDNLNFEKAKEINEKFKDRVNVSFGIGTNITNDFPGVTPLNIVMKVVEANGRPVAKISDSEGKIMCEDEEYVKYLKSECGIK
jgi:nicotinate phosphoribosyltransferase